MESRERHVDATSALVKIKRCDIVQLSPGREGLKAAFVDHGEGAMRHLHKLGVSCSLVSIMGATCLDSNGTPVDPDECSRRI